MKRVLLICPDAPPALAPVLGGLPPALAVYLGRPLIEHALDGLVCDGVTDVRILASDRPSDLRACVADGAAWGLRVEVVPESSEPTAEQAARKHASFAPDATLRLDALPQAPKVPLLTDPAAWHASRALLLPLLAPRQIGAREIAPGVWLGLKARADATATLLAPCWIGPHARVRAGATVGPRGFVESDSLIDSHAAVEDATVGNRTYLGGLTHLRESLATGRTLLNWRTGSQTRVTDAFLLSPLDPPHLAATSPLPRLLAALVVLLTLPVPLLAWVLSLLRREPAFHLHQAALPSEPGTPRPEVTYADLPILHGPLSRWPRLLRIVTGHFAWTGNPPLDPGQAAALDGEFERLWLDVAPGLFTAPEAEGCRAPWDDAARAHAALFACQPTPAWRLKILRRGLARLIHRSPP